MLKAIRNVVISAVSAATLLFAGSAMAAPSALSGAGANTTCNNTVNIGTVARSGGTNGVGADLNCTAYTGNTQTGAFNNAGSTTKSNVLLNADLAARRNGTNDLTVGVNTLNKVNTTQTGLGNGAGSSLVTNTTLNVKANASNGLNIIRVNSNTTADTTNIH
jgi:hypothetical protein